MRHSNPPASDSCVFCQELEQGHTVGELGGAAALLDDFPVSEGHTLIVPKRHVADLFELDEGEIRDIWLLLRQVREEMIRRDPTIRACNVGVNSGVEAGQTVLHAHVHLIPRRRGDTPDPRGGVRGVIPEQMTYAR
jgi:ATP adenylyltransferase